jgi:CheY-like chemotaxis protein
MILAAQRKSSPVLLVEDDPIDVFFALKAFKAAGVQNTIIVAHDGAEAMEILKLRNQSSLHVPALVITDVKMPRVDGFDLLVWLRTEPQFETIPRLVISSSVLEADVAKSLELGATAYFVKRNALPELIELVRGWKETFLEGNQECECDDVSAGPARSFR